MKKKCVITGATSGIGLAITRRLAKENFSLVLIGRDARKGEMVKNELVRQSNDADITFYPIDLASQQQIKTVGEKIKREHPVIDVLINNAGIWISDFTLTEDGIEKQFAVNHLAYFLLTHVLYQNLALSSDGRIINIGSDSHKFGKMHFENLNLKGSYHGLKAYAQSKLANMLFTRYLHQRKQESNVSTYCVQPGLVKTDIGVKHTNPFHALMWKLRRLGGVSADEAANTPVYLATAAEVKGKSGLYWDRCKPKPCSKRAENMQDAQRLWTESEKLCGIKSFFMWSYTP